MTSDRRRFPDPRRELGDTKRVLLTYLDYFRETIAEKLAGLTDEQLRSSILPSGWSPLEMLRHLVFMERRWLVWGFLGEDVDAPWGDREPGDRWALTPADSLDALLAALRAGGVRTQEIVSPVELSAQAQHGGRFPEGTPAPVLERILLHVMQEYARHAGHLDVVRELLDGQIGE